MSPYVKLGQMLLGKHTLVKTLQEKKICEETLPSAG